MTSHNTTAFAAGAPLPTTEIIAVVPLEEDPIAEPTIFEKDPDILVVYRIGDEPEQGLRLTALQASDLQLNLIHALHPLPMFLAEGEVALPSAYKPVFERLAVRMVGSVHRARDEFAMSLDRPDGSTLHCRLSVADAHWVFVSLASYFMRNHSEMSSGMSSSPVSVPQGDENP